MDYVKNESTNDLIVGVMERQIKRMFILIIILVLSLVGSNIGWLIYESQYDSYVVSQTANTDSGGDVTVSGVGDINAESAENK